MMKKILIALIAVLVATGIFGAVLMGDVTSGARFFHRILAFGAIGLAIVVMAMSFMRPMPRFIRGLSSGLVVLTITATMAGTSITFGAEYELALNLMRVSGMLALVVAIVIMVIYHKQTKK